MCDLQLDAVETLEMPGRRKAVAAALARWSDPGGFVKASVKKLSTHTGTCPRNIRACLDELQEVGLLQEIDRRNAKYQCRFRPMAGGW